MAKKKSKQTGAKDWKKKSWYPIIAPKVLNNAVLGESVVSDVAVLNGKTVRLSLMTVLGDIKKQNNWVKLRVTGIREGKAQTRIISYEVSPSVIKRFVRRRRDKIDCSYLCVTRDGVQVRIKPFIVTRNNTSNSTLTDLRAKVKDYLLRAAANTPYDDLFNNIIRGRLQMDLKRTISKIYPIKKCDIRKIIHIKDGVEVDKSLIRAPVQRKEVPRKEVAPKPVVKTVPIKKVEEKKKEEVKENAKTSN